MTEQENPFATVGHIVYGDAHVGRTACIEVLRQRVLVPVRYAGATAIVGPPRIGKSSLAYHVFMRTEVRTEHPALLPVWINVRTQAGGPQLFRRLVDEVWTMLTDVAPDQLDEPLRRRYERVTDPGREWQELQDDTQQFLKLVRRRGWKVLLILDEFDAAREVFKPQPGTFQALRELAYNPDWSIGLVTTSRRELREVVGRADPVESTFPGIFREVFLTCFDQDEMAALVERVPDAESLPGTTALAIRLRELTGGHPYLASVLLERICAGRQAAARSALSLDQVEAATGGVPAEFHHYYRDLEELLRADDRFHALLEVVLGPQITVTLEDAERLLLQGLIRVENASYRAFSDHFQQYLTLVDRESDHWDTWVAVESGIRDLVETTFMEMYGPEWVAEVRRTRPKLVAMLDKCDELKEREQRSFGPRASSRLLDFTYPRDLYALMAAHWDLFGKVLQHDKKYWNDRFELLSKVRNPMAHNRMFVVTPVERTLFQAYCAEILEVVGNQAAAQSQR